MTRLIAEYKRRSPWDGELTGRALKDVVSEYDSDPNVFAISIVADERWGGEPADIAEARRVTDKPILAKIGPGSSFPHEYPDWGADALTLGATWYLTHDWVKAADDPAHAWLEVGGPDSTAPTLDQLPLVVVCNNRDLETGEVDLSRSIEEKGKLLGADTLFCAASGFRWPWECPETFDFCLMGTALLKGE